ncbi:MAG: RNA-guided endonuclease InsQ/TnpB family protein, partial [Microcystis aeruginosa]
MLVVEAKLKNGTPEQYHRLDEAIKTSQFVRNSCVRYWLDNQGTTRNDLQKLCAVLANNKETPWVNKLNSQARQSAADRAWQSINRFYQNCHAKIPGKKGFPRFKKHNRSVEYKLTGYKLSDDRRKIKFTDGFKAGEFDLWCSQKTLVYYSEQQIKRVRVVRRADGYYCQFLIDVERQEYHGLKEFYADVQGNNVENPRYLSKSEKRLKKAQRRLSKRFRQGKKQSKNYHKQRIKVAKLHLKVSRQRKDKAIKDALALVQSNDLVVYEALKVRNLVKNRKLAKSISDASWYQFTEWFEFFAKIYQIVCVAVPPHFTSQDCSVCG